MPVTVLSMEKLGKDAKCQLCKAGNISIFNWQYALKNSNTNLPNDKNIYLDPVALKSGVMFSCRACGAHWYLDSEEHFMSHVEESKVQLIHEWNSKTILLTEAQRSVVNQIGGILKSNYGSQSYETPCTVRTKSGEVLELSVIAIQKYAPFEDWKSYRLASEIEEISPSQYALPWDVRKATFEAREIRMDFAPTLVRLSDDQKLILPWSQCFLKKEGVKAGETKVCRQRIDFSNMPEIYSLSEKVVYFIADPVEGDMASLNNGFGTEFKKPGLFQRLARLFGAR